MRADTGILDGSIALWQQDLLYDYTLKVQDQEFRVHKFVLASVSEYFRVMLSGPMSHSTNDSVELKEVNAELISNLIKYIYTGDNSFISSRPKEMLELAVYFQMPTVVEKCKENLMTEVSVENCLNLWATYKVSGLQEGMDTVASFIKSNAIKFIQHYKPEEFTQDILEIVLDAVSFQDLSLFFYLIAWFGVDFDKRKQYADHFMSWVKFHRMSADDIIQISKQMDFIKLDGSWKDRFEKAFVYHRLPIHLKILNDLEQTKIESSKSLIVITIEQDSNGLSNATVLHQIEGEKNSWKTCMPLKTPKISGSMPFVIEVNNFLITCSEFGKNQKWQVFDPRTLMWYKIANMSRPRDKFAMVQHDRHLYVFGGCIGSTLSKFLTDTVEEYSFDTGTWSSTKKLPVAVKNHSACALNGCIYISGGQIAREEGSVLSATLYCLNLSTGTWESKASMLRPMANHKMCVMRVEEKETIVVINQALEIYYYDPLSDQWSTCEFSVNKHNYDDFREEDDTTTVDVKNLKWGPESRMFVEGNTVYFVNLVGQELKYYEGLDDFQYWRGDSICVKWMVAEEKRDEINEFTLSSFPTCTVRSLVPVRRQPIFKEYPPLNVIYGLLAFPPNVLKYKTYNLWG